MKLLLNKIEKARVKLHSWEISELMIPAFA